MLNTNYPTNKTRLTMPVISSDLPPLIIKLDDFLDPNFSYWWKIKGKIKIMLNRNNNNNATLL